MFPYAIQIDISVCTFNFVVPDGNTFKTVCALEKKAD